MMINNKSNSSSNKYYLSKKKYTKCFVGEKKQIKDDIYLIRINLGDENSTTGMKAGEYISLKILNMGDKSTNFKKYFSVASHPDRNYLDLIIKVNYPKDGKFISALEPGNVVYIKNEGGYEYDPVNHKKYGMILGGTGLSCGLQILSKKLSSSEDKSKIKVIYGSRTVDDLLCRNRLEEINKDDNVDIHYITDKKPTVEDLSKNEIDSKKWEFNCGYVDEEFLTKFFPDKKTFIILCGPYVMCKNLKKILEKNGYNYFSYM